MEVFLSKKQRKRRSRNIRIKLYLWLGLVLLISVLAVYAVFKLPFLQIKKFETTGLINLEDVQTAILKGRLARFLGAENFLSWPKEVGNLVVDKDYFKGVLKLTANAPDRFVIWCSANSVECYWVDRDGTAVEVAPDTEGSAIFKIKDSRGAQLISGQPVLDKTLFENVVKIVDGISKLPIAIADFGFSELLQELTANGARGERIIFSLRFAPSEKAFSYLNDLIASGKLRASAYVDLTVENRIYLKPR